MEVHLIGNSSKWNFVIEEESSEIVHCLGTSVTNLYLMQTLMINI